MNCDDALESARLKQANDESQLPANIYESGIQVQNDQQNMNFEKLYDLDTSRFEEEYSNLPSNHKKILWEQLDDKEEEKKEISGVSRFNLSLD